MEAIKVILGLAMATLDEILGCFLRQEILEPLEMMIGIIFAPQSANDAAAAAEMFFTLALT